MLRNTDDYTKDGKKRMLTVSILQILAVVAMVFIMGEWGGAGQGGSGVH